MIKSIRLQNWRSHADTLLEFREGTNLLVGAMGSGKSSVMDAISFALFGTFPALERRKIKLQDIFRMNEDKASIIMELGWNGSNYRIERKLSKGKQKVDSAGEIFKDSKLVESGQSAITEYVGSLLSVDYDLFTRAIYSEQNNIDYFLTLDPRRRKQELDALLGLDRFEIARTNIVSVINRMKDNRELLATRFDKTKQATAIEKQNQNQAEIEKSKTKKLELESLLKEQTLALDQIQIIYSKMSKDKETFERLSREKIMLETSLSNLKTELEGKQADETKLGVLKSENEVARKNKETLAKELQDTHKLLSQFSKEIGSIETRLKRLEQSRKELEQNKLALCETIKEETIELLESRKSEAEKDAISLQSEHQSILADIKESDDLLKNIKPGVSKCPLCEGELGQSGTDKIIHNKLERIALHKSRINELEKLIISKKKVTSDLNIILKRADSISTQISRLEKEIELESITLPSLIDLQEKAKTENMKKETIEKSVREYDEKIQKLALDLNGMELLVKKQKQSIEASARLEETKTKLKALGFDGIVFETHRMKLEETKIALERIVNEKSSLDKQLTMLEQMEIQLKNEIDEYQKLEKEIARYQKLEEELVIFRNALLETQTSLRSGLTDAINSAMGEVWAIFYPYQNYPKIRLSVNEKDYLFEVFEREEWKNLESVASGGERACAALTLRVALAIVLTPNLSWLILDEPTHNLDSEAVGLLSQTLQTRVPEVVKQTFVITHEEGLMGADFASSFRLERDKSESGPTKAERI